MVAVAREFEALGRAERVLGRWAKNFHLPASADDSGPGDEIARIERAIRHMDVGVLEEYPQVRLVSVVRFLVVIRPGCPDRMDGDCWEPGWSVGLLGSHVLRWSSSGSATVALVWWIDVVLVPWASAVLVPGIDVVPLRAVLVECSTEIP